MFEGLLSASPCCPSATALSWRDNRKQDAIPVLHFSTVWTETNGEVDLLFRAGPQPAVSFNAAAFSTTSPWMSSEGDCEKRCSVSGRNSVLAGLGW